MKQLVFFTKDAMKSVIVQYYILYFLIIQTTVFTFELYQRYLKSTFLRLSKSNFFSKLIFKLDIHLIVFIFDCTLILSCNLSSSSCFSSALVSPKCSITKTLFDLPQCNIMPKDKQAREAPIRFPTHSPMSFLCMPALISSCKKNAFI